MGQIDPNVSSVIFFEQGSRLIIIKYKIDSKHLFIDKHSILLKEIFSSVVKSSLNFDPINKNNFFPTCFSSASTILTGTCNLRLIYVSIVTITFS